MPFFVYVFFFVFCWSRDLHKGKLLKQAYASESVLITGVTVNLAPMGSVPPGGQDTPGYLAPHPGQLAPHPRKPGKLNSK